MHSHDPSIGPSLRFAPFFALSLLLVLLVRPVDAVGQRFTEVPPEPGMPSAEGFEKDRALFFAEPNFTPLRDPEWQSLRGARRSRDVADDTPLLVFEVAGRTLSLVSSQMSYHHVAQGEMAGEPWMVTF